MLACAARIALPMTRGQCLASVNTPLPCAIDTTSLPSSPHTRARAITARRDGTKGLQSTRPHTAVLVCFWRVPTVFLVFSPPTPGLGRQAKSKIPATCCIRRQYTVKPSAIRVRTKHPSAFLSVFACIVVCSMCCWDRVVKNVAPASCAWPSLGSD